MASATEGYARPDMLVETEWLAGHLQDPTIRIVDTGLARSMIGRISPAQSAIRILPFSIPVANGSRTKQPCWDRKHSPP